jgi:hypothetical protein
MALKGFFDGSLDRIQRGEEFSANKKDCLLYSPTITQAWITAENVNDLIFAVGCEGSSFFRCGWERLLYFQGYECSSATLDNCRVQQSRSSR